jgi:hypothetical protein
MNYQEFLNKKSQIGTMDGFNPLFMPSCLFDFQSALVDWSIKKGRSALFEDCGLGKTLQQLVWAENIVRKTDGNVLIITPMSVSSQTVREGEKFGIESHRSIDGKFKKGIVITNYERLHYFHSSDFDGAVCDESGILKNFDGIHKKEIIEFMRKMKYRLLCTATAAPNDYPELGNSSEALGELGYMDMLMRFFKNDENTLKSRRYIYKNKPSEILNESGHWRFKGHAEEQFWKWICSWARAIRKPSDMGFDDDGFLLPPLEEKEYLVKTERQLDKGKLFNMPAQGLKEQRDERRATVEDRCERAAELVNKTGKPALVFCHLNDEGDLLEKLIPDSVQVSGQDEDDKKEEALASFIDGKIRVLVTKPKIGAWGLNFQHCSHIISFPSHSFEQYYQGVRRCWRFGQKNPVRSDIITSIGEKNVLKNLRRKSIAADKMFEQLIKNMNTAIGIKRDSTSFLNIEKLPEWL